MTSSPDTPASSPVAPDSFSGAPIPGLSGHLVVAHVLDKLSDPTDLARVSAVSRGMRDAVAATGRTVMMPSEDEAVKKGYLSTVKHMHSRDRLSDTRLLCAAAAASGQLEGLKALRAENFPWDWRTCAGAAGGGHLETLKWARANGCPWIEGTCSYAAEGGHLESLKWARENGCPWDVFTARACSSGRERTAARGTVDVHLDGRPHRDAEVGARERLRARTATPVGRARRARDVRRGEGGHLDVLKWARANGCPWDDWTCTEARWGDHLNVLKWACANDCPWDMDTCEFAALGGHLDVLKWLREGRARTTAHGRARRARSRTRAEAGGAATSMC